MAKINNKTIKPNGKMGIILIGFAGAFIGVTIWEMAKKVNKEIKEGIKKQKAYDPHDQIYH